jgi:fumarate reductase subunit D
MAKSNKPIIWSVFAGGGTLTAFITPVMIFVTGLAIPFGIASRNTLSYERVLTFVQHPIGKAFLLAIFFLSFFHAAHRIFVSLHDLGIHGNKLVLMFLCYGSAAIATIISVIYLLGI